MHVSGRNSAGIGSNTLIFGAKRIYSTRGCQGCPHGRADLIPGFSAAFSVFLHLGHFVWGSKVRPAAVLPRAVRRFARDLEIRDQREILV